MRKTRYPLLVLLGSVFALAGCGGSSKSSSVAEGTHSSSSQGASALSHAASDNGEASKPAAQILADSAAALRGAHGYALRGTITQNGQRLALSFLAPAPSSLRLSIATAGTNVDMIVLPSGSFIRGNGAFWTAHLGARGSSLANRWIQVPPSSTQSISASLGHFAPATLARCLVENRGTLTVAGQTTVDGSPAVLLKDAGNAPGASPGTLAVATTGPPYPLRATATGPTRAGGRIDVCNNGKAGNTQGILTFSRFGAVPPISPPPNPIRTPAAST